MSDKIKTVETTEGKNAGQQFSPKRLGVADLHTMYETSFRKVKALSDAELAKVIAGSSYSQELKDMARQELHKRQDPRDNVNVEM